MRFRGLLIDAISKKACYLALGMTHVLRDTKAKF